MAGYEDDPTAHPTGVPGAAPTGDPTHEYAAQRLDDGWTRVGPDTFAHGDTYRDAAGNVVVMRGTTDIGSVAHTDATHDYTKHLAELRRDANAKDATHHDMAQYLAYKRSRKAQITKKYDHSLTEQVHTLEHGLELRDKPHIQHTDYSNVPHDVLARMLDGVHPGNVGHSGQNLIEAGNALTRLEQDGATAMQTSSADWRGAAGDNAREFTGKLVTYLGKAGVGMQLAGTQLTRQSEAAQQAKSAMPDLAPHDQAAANAGLQNFGGADPVELPLQAGKDMGAYHVAGQTQQQAAHVMHTYDRSLGSATAVPKFHTPPVMPGTQTGPVGTPVGGGGGTGGGGGGGGAGGGGTGGGGGPLPTFDDPGGTDPSSYNLPPMENTGSGWGRGSGPAPNVGGTGPFSGSGLFGGFGSGGRFGGLGGLGGGAESGSGGYGLGRSGAEAGSGGAGARGAGAAAGAAEGGRGGVAGRGGLAGEAGAAGRSGGMGGGVPPGGRGKKQEDDEHYAPSFLVEYDPDSIFGSDEKTVPPVIGE